MKKRFIPLILLIALTVLLCTVISYSKGEAQPNLTAKITYLGKFVNKKYEPMPGEEPVKLPAKMDSWPGDFYDPPDVIEVVAEITNNSKVTYKNVTINAKARYKLGKLVFNEDESVNIDQSKKNLKWGNYLFSKNISVKQITPGSKVTVKVADFFVENEWCRLYDLGDFAWEYEVSLGFVSPKINKTFSATFNIGFM